MIELKQAIEERHAVRSFQDRKIEKEILSQLSECIDEANSKGNINAQLVLDEPQAFSGMKAHYGKFSGVNNYIAMVGPKGWHRRKDWLLGRTYCIEGSATWTKHLLGRANIQ
jgi:nitroreductase